MRTLYKNLGKGKYPTFNRPIDDNKQNYVKHNVLNTQHKKQKVFFFHWGYLLLQKCVGKVAFIYEESNDKKLHLFTNTLKHSVGQNTGLPIAFK